MSQQPDSALADFIALAAILGLIVSGSINFNQWNEINRLSALSQSQQLKIETMERTLLMSK